MNIYLLFIMIAVNFYYNFNQLSWFSITLFMYCHEIMRGQTHAKFVCCNGCINVREKFIIFCNFCKRVKIVPLLKFSSYNLENRCRKKVSRCTAPA